jgi:hypothetical protein
MPSITSEFLENFLAQTRSRQISSETSLLKRDQVVIAALRYLQFLLERLDLHWSQNSPVVGLFVRDS